MKTTYTVKSKMPHPTVGVGAASAVLALYRTDNHVVPIVDFSKINRWISDVQSLLNEPSVLFASMVDGEVQISLTDKAVAAEFDKKWGAA
jgi:hypothetical protein